LDLFWKQDFSYMLRDHPFNLLFWWVVNDVHAHAE